MSLPEIKEMNEYEYLWYVGQLKDAGVLDIDWSSIADYMNHQFREDEEHYFSESVYRKNYAAAKKFYEAGVFSQTSEDAYSELLDEKTRTMQKERMKLQTEKTEYNKWLRENARDELITEQLVNAVQNLPPLEIPDPIQPVIGGKDYLLTIADAHYGIEFDLKGLMGETINAYSPEIFVQRMESIMDQIVGLIESEGITELKVWEMGDGLQGILRLNSQLMKLRYGILDSSILYADYLSNWLNKLSQYVRISFQMMVDSNHNQLRICGAPKNAFADENMSKSMFVFIKERLKDNPNIEIISNPTGLNFDVMCWQYPCLGIHGEVKDLDKALDEYNRTYDINIHYLIGAHKHHTNDSEIGRKCETLSVRSIIGVDPYALSLNQTADAGANLFVFEENKGLICDYRLVVN